MGQTKARQRSIIPSLTAFSHQCHKRDKNNKQVKARGVSNLTADIFIKCNNSLTHSGQLI